MPRQREQFTSEELAIVLSNYDLGIVGGVREFPRGSHAAAKMVITTDKGKYLLKRRPKTEVDPYRVAFSHSLQSFLASRNFPLPHLIGTREHNNSMLKMGNSIYEVFEFIDGEPYDSGLVATYQSGKTLGLYHQLVREYEPEWDPPHGHYHDSKSVRAFFKPLAETLVKTPSVRGKKQDLIELLKLLRSAYTGAAKAANDLGMPKWETQIVHSDWHPGNMLFDKGHVVAVIDYDAARIQPRVMDVANGCTQFSFVAGGRDLSTWEDRTDHLRAKRFLRGYDEMNLLSKAELEAVPFLMQEVLIAQTIPPIIRTGGTFAELDGFGFLNVVLRKVQWLQENRSRLDLDAPDE
ncbi:MAG: phosphotransferase [Phycisphaerae bacterium]|nr:phosphotransferase [Phycisphaerae bacterium]